MKTVFAFLFLCGSAAAATGQVTLVSDNFSCTSPCGAGTPITQHAPNSASGTVWPWTQITGAFSMNGSGTPGVFVNSQGTSLASINNSTLSPANTFPVGTLVTVQVVGTLEDTSAYLIGPTIMDASGNYFSFDITGAPGTFGFNFAVGCFSPYNFTGTGSTGVGIASGSPGLTVGHSYRLTFTLLNTGSIDTITAMGEDVTTTPTTIYGPSTGTSPLIPAVSTVGLTGYMTSSGRQGSTQGFLITSYTATYTNLFTASPAFVAPGTTSATINLTPGTNAQWSAPSTPTFGSSGCTINSQSVSSPSAASLNVTFSSSPNVPCTITDNSPSGSPLTTTITTYDLPSSAGFFFPPAGWNTCTNGGVSGMCTNSAGNYFYYAYTSTASPTSSILIFSLPPSVAAEQVAVSWDASPDTIVDLVKVGGTNLLVLPSGPSGSHVVKVTYRSYSIGDDIWGASTGLPRNALMVVGMGSVGGTITPVAPTTKPGRVHCAGESHENGYGSFLPTPGNYVDDVTTMEGRDIPCAGYAFALNAEYSTAVYPGQAWGGGGSGGAPQFAQPSGENSWNQNWHGKTRSFTGVTGVIITHGDNDSNGTTVSNGIATVVPALRALLGPTVPILFPVPGVTQKWLSVTKSAVATTGDPYACVADTTLGQMDLNSIMGGNSPGTAPVSYFSGPSSFGSLAEGQGKAGHWNVEWMTRWTMRAVAQVNACVNGNRPLAIGIAQ